MPLGKNSKRVQFVIPTKYAERVEKAARRADKSVSKYLREIFIKGNCR